MSGDHNEYQKPYSYLDRAKPITSEEMTAYVESTWNKCQGEAWRREDTIKLSREAYLDDLKNHARTLAHLLVSLRGIAEDQAALVAAAEREACAQVVEAIERNGAWVTKQEAAAAIRARGDR